MPTALYSITLTKHPVVRQNYEPASAADFRALATDPQFGVYDQRADKLEVYVEWKGFAAKYPSLATFAGFEGSSKRDIDKDCGTAALPRYRASKLDDARDALRRIPLPPTGPTDPANQTGITPLMDAATGRQALMANSGGFCQGRDHGKPEPLEALTQGLDDGSLLNGGGLLFIEELKVELQDMLDSWLGDATAAMPEALEKAIKAHDDGCAPKTPFMDLLNKSKQKGIKVFGIDGGDADAGIEKNVAKVHAGQPERRAVKMNALAKGVIDVAKARFPGLPMIASVGEAHMNHHEGGVPGSRKSWVSPV